LIESSWCCESPITPEICSIKHLPTNSLWQI